MQGSGPRPHSLQLTNHFQHLMLISQLPHLQLPLLVLAPIFFALPLQLGLQMSLALFEAQNLSFWGERFGVRAYEKL